MITTGALILRGLDALARAHTRGADAFRVVDGLDADLLRMLEPWAPPPAARLELMRRLAAAGLDLAHIITSAAVSCASRRP